MTYLEKNLRKGTMIRGYSYICQVTVLWQMQGSHGLVFLNFSL